jgi:hypothetical protein
MLDGYGRDASALRDLYSRHRLCRLQGVSTGLTLRHCRDCRDDGPDDCELPHAASKRIDHCIRRIGGLALPMPRSQ